MPVGASPTTPEQVNYSIGIHLQNFVGIKNTIFNDWAWLAAEDLTQPPYNMTSADQTTIKTAVNGLNTSLQAVDMTFINRLTGLF